MNRPSSRQLLILNKLRDVIAQIGETLGESSAVHLDAREVANDLEWYFENRVPEEAR